MSTNPLNDLSKVYLDRVATLNTDLEDKSVKRWEDMGGPTPGNYKADNNSAKLSQEGRKLKVGNKEQFSNWRGEGFFEAITTPTTDSKALRKIDEKGGINNKVEINPKLKEAVAEMGGELLGVKEETDAQLKKQEKEVYDDEKKDAESDQIAAKEKRANMIKRQVLLKKMQAVRQGGGATIMASYDPMDDPTFDPHEAEKTRGVSGKDNPKGGKKLKKIVKQLSKEAASYETVKKGEVLGALKRDNEGRKKPLSVKDRDKIADKVVRDKGDTSKSDDRYAYEEVLKTGQLDETLPMHARIKSVSKADMEKMAIDDHKAAMKKLADQSTKNRGDLTKRDAGAMGRERLRQKQYEGFSDWRNDLEEAKVDKGKSDAEKAEARNKRNTPAGQDKDTDLKTFITRKPGESLGSARARVRRKQHDKQQAATRLAKSKERATGSLKKYDSDGDGKVRVIDAGYNPEGEIIDERLGGKGFSRKAASSGIHKTSGDWPDSDRGEGNKAKRRAGEKVEAKSPTYLAHVHNKKAAVGEGKSPEQSGIVTPEERERRRKKNTKIWEGKIADALRKTIADMKAADRKLGLLPGGPDVVDLSVERERRRKKKVDEGKLTSVKATTYGMPPEERKALIDAERKRLGVKPKPDKKVEEEVGISSSAAMEKARKEAELRRKEQDIVKGVKKNFGAEDIAKKKHKEKFGGVAEAKVDQAFDNVVRALRKKHGESGVLTKDSPKPKPQPKRKPEPQKPLTAAEKAQREVDARYGRTPWNKKGSLGT